MVERGELLEWAEFAGHRYGTPRAPVEERLAAGVARAARDRAAGRPAGPRGRCRTRCWSSWRRRRGTSWSRRLVGRGTEAGRRSSPAGWSRPGSSWRPQREFDAVARQRRRRGRRDRLVALMGLSASPDRAGLRPTSSPAELTAQHAASLQEGPPCPAPPPLPRASPTRRSTSCSTKADSKYGLVIYAAKRARQINAYYSQLGEGLLEYVGPLVETHVAGEAAVDRAARDQRRPAHPRARRADPAEALSRASPTRPDRRHWPPPARVVLGVGGGIAAYKACELLRRLTEAGPRRHASCRPRPRCSSSARPPGRRCPASRSPPTCGTTSHEVPHVATRPGGRPRRGRARPPPTCWPGPRTAWPTTCSPTRCSPRAARCVHGPGHAHRDVGAPGHPWPTSRRCARAASLVLEPAVGRLTGADTGTGPAARAGRDPRPCGACCVLARGARRRRPGRAPGRRHRRRHPRAARPGALPGQPVQRPAGLRARRVGRGPRRRGRRSSPPTSRCADPAGVDGRPRSARAEELRAAVHRGRRRRRRRRDGRRGRPTSGRPSRGRAKIKKDDAATPAPVALEPNPDVLAELVADAPRAGQVVVGFAAETGDAERDWLAHGRAKLAPQGLRPARGQRGRRRSRLRGRRQRGRRARRGRSARPRSRSGPKDALADVVWDLVDRPLLLTR